MAQRVWGRCKLFLPPQWVNSRNCLRRYQRWLYWKDLRGHPTREAQNFSTRNTSCSQLSQSLEPLASLRRQYCLGLCSPKASLQTPTFLQSAKACEFIECVVNTPTPSRRYVVVERKITGKIVLVGLRALRLTGRLVERDLDD